MSVYHCSCGFAIDDADEFGDHLREVFDRPGDLGADGRVHAEVTGVTSGADRRQPWHVCACGFETGDTAEFDDHALLVLIPPDNTGTDGTKHIPVDPSTPDRWYIQGTPGE